MATRRQGAQQGESCVLELGYERILTTIEIRVRTLYPYEGQRDVHLSFAENVVIAAHPAKDPNGEWWYGTTVKSGEKGWFPHSFVSELGREYLLLLSGPLQPGCRQFWTGHRADIEILTM